MKIGLDAMGGDLAPEAAVSGAIDAVKFFKPGTRLVLFGDKESIEAVLKREKCPVDTFDIVHTTQVINMGDNPAQAFVKKPDSSIAVGFDWLKTGRIEGFASAGSTGAMMAGSIFAVKPVEGVMRPAISSLLPTDEGRMSVLLDVGLNVDCKPEVLFQYGIIGSLYAEAVLGIEKPRVALLNIGEEEEKGNQQTKAAYELMKGTDRFDFVGNVEAKYIFTKAVADVVVCDGFVGNTIIKQAEGFYNILSGRGLSSPLLDGLNYETVGGTPVLGINSTVIIGHGCSSPEAVKNMILQTEASAVSGLVGKFTKAFKNVNG